MVWLNGKCDKFSVKSLFSYLFDGRIEVFPFGIVWTPWVLLKVCFFAWDNGGV